MPALMLCDDDVQPTQLSNASILNLVGSQVDSELKAEVAFSCSGVKFFALAVPHTLESILRMVPTFVNAHSFCASRRHLV